eukprot:6084012-Amphidinium_carterae.1
MQLQCESVHTFAVHPHEGACSIDASKSATKMLRGNAAQAPPQPLAYLKHGPHPWRTPTYVLQDRPEDVPQVCRHGSKAKKSETANPLFS